MADLMEYKGYHAKVEYDPDDKLLVGKVFGISDSLNFHAKDVDELEEAFHTSIQGCARAGTGHRPGTPDQSGRLGRTQDGSLHRQKAEVGKRAEQVNLCRKGVAYEV